MKAKFITHKNKRYIALVFDYSMYSRVKYLEGFRYFNRDSIAWVSITYNNVSALIIIRCTLSSEMRKWYRRKTMYYKINKITDFVNQNKLFGYQISGVRFMQRMHGNVLIADEMGLGKTVQAILYSRLVNAKQTIIVCPASLKLNWKREIQKWTRNQSTIILSGKGTPFLLQYNYYIINYDILQNWQSYLSDLQPDILIVDEIHYVKNASTRRSKYLKKLAGDINSVIGLSGTPIENSPKELYNIINIIRPDLFVNRLKYLKRYCGRGGFYGFKEATNTEELHQILRYSLMIRRNKTDVLTELPDKLYTTIPLPITTRRQYDLCLYNIHKYLTEKVLQEVEIAKLAALSANDVQYLTEDAAAISQKIFDAEEKQNPLTRLEMLKQIAVEGKMTSVIQWIENFLQSGNKLVVFCEHVNTIQILQEKFIKNSVVIYGAISIAKRDEAVQKFQTKKHINLFIGNKAAEVGLTLTAASSVAMIEFPWTPGAVQQRIDRVHRIGQRNTVNVYYLVAENTIEERIISILSQKLQMISAVVDGRFAGEVNNNIFLQILKELK